MCYSEDVFAFPIMFVAASVTEEEISTPSVDVNSDSTIDDVTETVNENEETTSPVYTTTTTQEQSTRDESEYTALGILDGKLARKLGARLTSPRHEVVLQCVCRCVRARGCENV